MPRFDDDAASIVSSSAGSVMGERKIPTVIANKTKEELQVYVLDLLKKLKIRDKRIEELFASKGGSTSEAADHGGVAVLLRRAEGAEAAAREATEAGSALRAELALTKESLAEAHARAEEVLTQLAESQSQGDALVASSREGAMAAEERMQEQMREMESMRAALEASKQSVRDWSERESAYQQQLSSLKTALKNLSEEREGAFSRLGETRERIAELEDRLAEVESTAEERVAAATAELCTAQAHIESLKTELAGAKAAVDAATCAAAVERSEAQAHVARLEAELISAREAASSAAVEVAAYQGRVTTLDTELAATKSAAAADMATALARVTCLEAEVTSVKAAAEAAGTAASSEPAAEQRRASHVAVESADVKASASTEARTAGLQAELATTAGRVEALSRNLAEARVAKPAPPSTPPAASRSSGGAEATLCEAQVRIVELEGELIATARKLAEHEDRAVAAMKKQKKEYCALETKLAAVQQQLVMTQQQLTTAKQQVKTSSVAPLAILGSGDSTAEKGSENGKVDGTHGDTDAGLAAPVQQRLRALEAQLAESVARVEELDKLNERLIAEREELLTLQDQSAGEITTRLAALSEKEREIGALQMELRSRDARMEEMQARLDDQETAEADGGCEVAQVQELLRSRDQIEANVESLVAVTAEMAVAVRRADEVAQAHGSAVEALSLRCGERTMDGEQLRAELLEARNDLHQKAAAVTSLTVQLETAAADIEALRHDILMIREERDAAVRAREEAGHAPVAAQVELQRQVQELRQQLTAAQAAAETQGGDAAKVAAAAAARASELETELDELQASLVQRQEGEERREYLHRQQLEDLRQQYEQRLATAEGCAREAQATLEIQISKLKEQLNRVSEDSASTEQQLRQQFTAELQSAHHTSEVLRARVSELECAQEVLEARGREALARAQELEAKLTVSVEALMAVQAHVVQLETAAAAAAKAAVEAAASAEAREQQRLAVEAEAGCAAAASAAAKCTDLSHQLDDLAAEKDRLLKDLQESKRKLVALAKKRQLEVAAAGREAEAKVAAAEREAGAVRAELAAAMEAAAEERGALSTRVSELSASETELKRQLAAANVELGQRDALLQDYRSLAAQREGAAGSATARMEQEIKRLQHEYEVALSKTQTKLRDREVEIESLGVGLARAEKEAAAAAADVAEARRAAAAAASGTSAEVAAARAEADVLRGDVAALRKELEMERVKVAKATEDARKRCAKSQKAQHAAEVALAEARGKAQAETAGARAELGLVQQQLEGMRREKEAIETELRDYRNRAQALLKSKDAEIARAREAATSVAAAAESEELLALRLQMAAALEAAAAAEREGQEALERSASEAAAEVERLRLQLDQARSSAEYYQELLQRAQASAEEYGRRVEALEARLAHHSAEGEAGRRAAEQLETADSRTKALMEELASCREELRSFRASSEVLMEAKDAEVLTLVRRNALLQEDVVAVRHTLAAAEAAAIEAQAAAAQARDEADAAAMQLEARARRAALLDDEDRLHAAALEAYNPPPMSSMAASASRSLSEQALPGSLDVQGSKSAGGDILSSLIRLDTLIGSTEGKGRTVSTGGRAAAVAPVTSEEPLLTSQLPRVLGSVFALTSAAPTDEGLAVSSLGGGGLPPAAAGDGVLPSPAAAAANGRTGITNGDATAALAAVQRENFTLRSHVTGLEREVEELEKEVALREEMERALKESVRDMERAMQRQMKGASIIDAEYLKNTIIKMFLTGEAEKLLPVFATILSFSPDEVKRCRDSIAEINRGEVPLPSAAAAVDVSLSAFNTLTSWTNWQGGGGGGGGGGGSAQGKG